MVDTNDVNNVNVNEVVVNKEDVNKQFGSKINELFDLINTTEDWEQYLSKKTLSVIKTLIKTQSMKDTMQEFDMKYVTVRSHILRAIDRISNKNTEFKREGKTERSQELFKLMDEVPDWEQYVTNHEAELAKQFRDIRNFYELSRQTGVAASNIAGILYGSSQKIGVIAKIQSRVLQEDRRDIDKRREQI